MPLIPIGLNNKWMKIYRQHQYCVNSENIYFNTLRLVNKHHKLIDRDSYVEYFKNLTYDINLESHPIDIFVPIEDNATEVDIENTLPNIVNVSREVPEYKHISERFTFDSLCEYLPPEHPAYVKLKESPGLYDIAIDDIVLYWALFKFIDEIEKLRMSDLSIMKPIIDYTINELTLDKFKDFMSTNRINIKKVRKWTNDNFFSPNLDHISEFYLTGPVLINLDNLIGRLCSNIVFNNDIYIIISLYLILGIAKDDIKNNIDTEYTNYVREVIAKL